MRTELTKSLLRLASSKKMIFLTGDLGYMALESLKEKLKNRFINAGVAEQNMIGVAAGMASEGMSPWVYSIAPFCYARPFEQIRNDIAFHNLPVKLIGNGGGYGYGVMGPTHHAIEDYGILLTLPNFIIYIPCFNEDIDQIISLANTNSSPVYIRLGYDESPKDYMPEAYKPWRLLTKGDGPIVIVAGPIATTYIDAFQKIHKSNRPNLWLISELPVREKLMPNALLRQLKEERVIYIIEEHVEQGGIASQISLLLHQLNVKVERFINFFAKAHHYKTYGSQKFLRKESGLDIMSILKVLQKNKFNEH